MVAPVSHEYYHSREFSEYVALHAGHVHHAGHALDATRSAKLNHIVCVVREAANHAQLAVDDSFETPAAPLVFPAAYPKPVRWIGHRSQEIRGPPVA